MPRRSQRPHQETRRAHRKAVEKLGSEQGSYEPPDSDECHAYQWEMAGDDAYTIRVQYNIWRRDGRLAKFVVNLQVLAAEGWESVERIDCCHGHCHHHPENGKPAESVMRLDSVDDVERALGVVDGLIMDRVRILRR